MDSQEYLKSFNLTEKQIKIYLSLLRSGPATIINLSNRLKINRTSVHLLTQELIEKGILSETREKSKRMVLALPPEHLEHILELEEDSIRKKRLLMPDLVNAVYRDTSYVHEATQSNVKYYNTIDSIDWLYNQILKSKEIRTVVNASEIIKCFPNNGQRFMEAVKSGSKLWDLHVYSSIIEAPFDQIEDIYPNFHIKKLPPSVKFQSIDYLIYENKIAIIYGFPRPHAIVIENEAYSQMSVALYDLTWKLL